MSCFSPFLVGNCYADASVASVFCCLVVVVSAVGSRICWIDRAFAGDVGINRFVMGAVWFRDDLKGQPASSRPKMALATCGPMGGQHADACGSENALTHILIGRWWRSFHSSWFDQKFIENMVFLAPVGAGIGADLNSGG